MKRVMTMLGVVGFCSVAAVAMAQTPAPAAKAEKTAKKAAAAMAPITGCVAAGTDAKHYTLTGDDKTTYDLVGGSLKSHVGHKVEVTGTPAKAKAAGGNPTLKVKAVKEVATSCS